MNLRLSIIIILSSGYSKWLKKCFNSLREQNYQNFEIIVVNNDTQDDSMDLVNRYKNNLNLKIIHSDTNLGFAEGNNLGVRNAGGKYVMLLNPDVWMKSDFLEKLINFFEQNNYNAVSALEGNYDTGKIKNKNFYTCIDPFGYTISLPKKNNEEQFNICGFCILTKKDLYEESGGLDKDFFMYVEEIDWCWRLHLMDKTVGLAENIVLYHAGTADGQEPKYFTFLCRNRNIPQMLLKNYAWYNLFWVLPSYFIQNIFEILFFFFTGQFKFAWSYIQGWGFMIKNFPQIIKKRTWVQAKRKISDKEIMKKYFYWGNAKLHHLTSYYKLR